MLFILPMLSPLRRKLASRLRLPGGLCTMSRAVREDGGSRPIQTRG